MRWFNWCFAAAMLLFSVGCGDSGTALYTEATEAQLTAILKVSSNITDVGDKQVAALKKIEESTTKTADALDALRDMLERNQSAGTALTSAKPEEAAEAETPAEPEAKEEPKVSAVENLADGVHPCKCNGKDCQCVISGGKCFCDGVECECAIIDGKCVCVAKAGVSAGAERLGSLGSAPGKAEARTVAARTVDWPAGVRLQMFSPSGRVSASQGQQVVTYETRMQCNRGRCSLVRVPVYSSAPADGWVGSGSGVSSLAEKWKTEEEPQLDVNVEHFDSAGQDAMRTAVDPNVLTFFVVRDGRIATRLTGYWSAEDLAESAARVSRASL